MRKIKFFYTAVFLMVFSGISHANVLVDRVVAIVNQEVITWSELYKAMEADASPKIKELQNDERRKIFKGNEAFFLETFINVRLQLQEANNIGIRVSDQELQEAVDNIKKKYSMADDVFIESLKSEGFSYEEYINRLKEQIIVSKLVNMQIRSKIVINDKNINKFIAENKEIFENSGSYIISQILLKKRKDTDNSRIEEKADELLRKIGQGESFSDLAKQYSEDHSANSGGSLGSLKKNQLNKDFSDILSEMQPGDVSKPFWTDSGLHIIKLESSSEVKNQEAIMEEAKRMLEDKIFSEKYNAWIKSLREKSFIEVRL